MSALNRRVRVLALRLTDEEHQMVRLACDQAGGHALSEFSRLILLQALQGGNSAAERRIAALESQVAQLKQSLETLTLATGRPE